MKELRAFSVVEFPVNHQNSRFEIEAVPSTWINENQTACYWPKENLNLEIQNSSSKPAETWELFPITRIFSTCDSYDEAQKNTKYFENHSEAESECERGSRKATKRYKPLKNKQGPPPTFPKGNLYEFPEPSFQLVSPTASSQQIQTSTQPFTTPSLQPSTPLFGLPGTSGNRTSGTNETPKLGRKVPKRHLNLLHESSNSIEFIPPGDTASSLQRKEDHVDLLALNISNRTSPFDHDDTLGFPPALTSQPIWQTYEPILDQQLGVASNLKPTGSSGSDQKNFQSIVIRQLAKIENQQKDILQLLQAIASSSLPAAGGNEKEYFSSLPEFPIPSASQLSRFEEYLISDENFERATKYFALLGGSSTDAIVKGILRRLLAREFALTISFTGKGNKNISFSHHVHILKLVLVATRRNQVSSSASESEIKKICMDYFRFLRPPTSATGGESN